jgi:hypothetical protein
MNLLAGNPGLPPTPMAIIGTLAFLVLAAGGFLAMAAMAASRRHQAQAAGREAAGAREVSASWPVRLRAEEPMFVRGPGMNSGRVSLRGEFIEVTHAFAAGRVLNGQEFYFPVRQAWLRVEPGVLRRQWIVITGTSSGQPAFVSVSPATGGRAALETMWHVLVAAGARPERHEGASARE